MRTQMSNIGMPGRDGVYFTITTTQIEDNRTLKSATKDKDGYYTGVPVATLGVASRNKTAYDTKSFLDQIMGEDTSMNRRLKEGTLFSEYGHPFVDLNSPQGMARLLHLEPKQKSNHIRSISVKRVEDLGLDLVLMDTKPSGPYGQYFDEAMQDPTQNVAFSLRGISKATFDRSTGITNRSLISLVTFDTAVASGGFREASKRYIDAATESLVADNRNNDFVYESTEIVNYQISPNDLMLVRNIAVESFTNTELNEIIKAHKVIIGSIDVGYVDPITKTILEQETGQRRSLFHKFSTVKR
jgi:hypothetical protein